MSLKTARRSRAVVAATAIAVGAVLLSGCSSSSGGSDSASPNTLTVQVETGNLPVYNAVVAAYEKQHPDVKVELQQVSQTAKTGSNLQVLTSNNAPDVAVVPTNTQVYTTLVNGKQLVDLSDLYSGSNLDTRFGTALADSLKNNGTPYVVPFVTSIYNVVYYNKALFTQAGITVPTDHRIASAADLIAMTGKLSAIGKQGLSVGAADNYQASWMVDAFLPTAATSDQLQNYLSSWQGSSVDLTANYTDAPFVDSLKQIQTLGNGGVFQSGYLGQTVAQSESNFVQGTAGMLLDGSYTAANLTKDGIAFDYDYLLLPPVESGTKTQVSLYNGDAAAIPVRAKNPQGAKDFLTTMLSLDVQSQLPSLGVLPVVNDVPTDQFTSLPKVVQDLLADEKANGGQPGWTSTVPGGLGQQLVDPKIQEMLNGNGSPEDIAKDVQTELETVRAGGSN